MRLRDVWLKDNLKFQTSNDTTLPVVLQFIQGTVTSKSKFTSGTIGNLNYAFAIDLPESTKYNNLCPGFSMINKIMETYKVLKFSRDELLEKFYIIEIPDFSNQALTPGFLDFIPFVFIGKDKIYQNHIGMIRSYYSKQAYILIDKNAKFIYNNLIKPIYTNLETHVTASNPISILIKFKRYYDKGESVSMPYKGTENPNQKNVYEMKINKAILRNNEYKVDFKILTSSLSENDFNHISFYRVKNNIEDYNPSITIAKYNALLKDEIIKNGIKLNNSFILKNLKIEVKQNNNEKNIIVNRQSTPSRDYYQILMAMLYNRYTSDDNDKNIVYQDFIDFSVSFDDYLRDGSNIIAVLDNNDSQMLCYDNNSNNLKIDNLDIDNADQLVVVKYNYNNLESTSFFYSAGEQPSFTFSKGTLQVPYDNLASYYEIIPLLYDDENYAFKVNSDVTSINIPAILKANNIYKSNLDLDYSTIFSYDINHKFIHLVKNSNDGTLSSTVSLKDATIILTASKDHTKVFTTLPAPESITSLGETNYNFDYTIIEDPYLELITDTINDHSSDFNIPTKEATLKNQPFLYDCTTNGYTDLEEVLIDNEPRITEDENGYYISTKVLTDKSEYTNYKSYVNSLKDKYNTMYYDVIESYLINTQDKYLNKQFDEIRKTFTDIYFNCSSIENSSNTFKYNGGSFLCLALELNENDYFDLVISSNGEVKYKEFNCIPIKKNNRYVYIHIPYYNFDTNKLGTQDEITKYTIEFIPRNSSTKVIKYSFIK